MTNPTPHGQVPEALIDLIDAYAETRHRCGGIYNAKTEAARNAVIEDLREALGGVQALSAAPEAIAKLRHLYQNMVNGAVRDTASAKRIAEGLLAPAIEALERATPPAEQQAAPKAAPGEPSDVEIDAFLDSPGDINWVIADKRERYRLLVRAVLAKWAAPQPAPAPLSFDACDMATAAAQGFRDGQSTTKQEE